MKILLLTSWYPDLHNPNSGIFIQTQAAALTSDHAVVVISSKIDYSKFSGMSYTLASSGHKDIHEHRLLINRSFPVYNQLNYFFITLNYSWKIARKFNPDIIHASVGYPGAFWGWALSKLLKKPFVFTEHTRLNNNFRSFFHKHLTLIGIKGANKLIAVSGALAREIETMTGKSVTIIPNIIDVDRFNINTHALPNEFIHLGFLGGMNTPVKGLDILLRAVQETHNKKIYLHIGGAGSLQESYQQLALELGIAQQCKFYGFIPYHQIPAFMGQLNFFICSSRYETFCVALIEAMASGLPVVATRCGGPEDFINRHNGILVDRESIQDLSKGVTSMIRDFSAYDRQAIRDYVINNFSKNTFLDRINEVYAAIKGY